MYDGKNIKIHFFARDNAVEYKCCGKLLITPKFWEDTFPCSLKFKSLNNARIFNGPSR